MQLIDGKLVSNLYFDSLKSKIDNSKTTLGLTIISVGNSIASKKYIKQKIKRADYLGVNCVHYHFDNVNENDLIDLIDNLNSDDKVNGIIVQLPLPSYLNKDKISNSISPLKDIDGLGKDSLFIPCTPKGILSLIDYYDIDLNNKNILIIGRSGLVGMPLYNIFKNNNLNVNLAHSKTNNIDELIMAADVIIIAIGNANYIKGNMIKNDVIIFDVGINVVNDKLCGDVDFDNVKDKVSMITPVPGGVGPMTVYELFNNLYLAYERKTKI